MYCEHSVRQTHKYAGRALHNKLKKRITRHESRSPKPKITGPRVPAENLCNISVGYDAAKQHEINAREDIEVHSQPDEEDFAELSVGPLMLSDGRNTYCGALDTHRNNTARAGAPLVSNPHCSNFLDHRCE